MKVEVKVRLFANFRECGRIKGGGPISIKIPEGANVERLFRELGLPLDAPKVILVNGRNASMSLTLRDGDQVAIFPPVEGG